MNQEHEEEGQRARKGGEERGMEGGGGSGVRKGLDRAPGHPMSWLCDN